MPLAFDTTGLQRHDERTWFDPRTGDQVSLTYFDLEPDLPASLEELPLLRQRLAHVLAEAGTLVEAHVVTIDSVPTLYQVVKLPIPGRQTGLMFVAALTVPKAAGSVVLQVLCQEGNTSGIRESMVSAQIGFENCFPPHPYAPGLQGMLPWNVADDQRWDNQFPEHPLSRARAWAHRTIRTAKVDPNFAQLPPFRPVTEGPPLFGGAAADSQHFGTPDAFGGPAGSQRPAAPDAFGTPEPQTFGSAADAQRPTAADAFGAPPEPQAFGGPTDSQRFAPPDAFGTAPEPQVFGVPDPQDAFRAPEPQMFGGPSDSQRPDAPDLFGTASEPQALGANSTDSERSAPPDAFGTSPEPETYGGPSDSERFTPPGNAQPSATPDLFGTPPEPHTFGAPTDSQRFTPPTDPQRPSAPDAFGAPEPQVFGGPSDSRRFSAPDSFGAPSEPQAFTAPEPAEPRKPRPFPAPQAFEPPADPPRKPRPFPAPPAESLDSPPTPRPFPTPQAFEPPAEQPPPPFPTPPAESLDSPNGFSPPADPPEPEQVAAGQEPPAGPPEPEPPAFSEPVAAPPPPAAAGDVLHTVLVGVPIGDYLPLWQREGQEDAVTFWRMSDPDAVRARLGAGVESRSAVDNGRYREAAMFSPERQMLFLMDRYRDDSGNLGGTSEQLFPATEDEAYQAADDKALSGLYSWLGEVMLAAVRRGEFVAVETGGWDVPVNPVVLVMLRTDGRDWHSVVETSPVPVGAPVWRDQQPVEGASQILASPATDQTLRASGLLTRFAINTWPMHPFQLGISFGPNPTLQDE